MRLYVYNYKRIVALFQSGTVKRKFQRTAGNGLQGGDKYLGDSIMLEMPIGS